jgi:signal transduction histidine kinase
MILLYQLERVYFLDNLAIELAAQGAIMASFLREEPLLWRDPELAEYAVEQLQERVSAQIMLVNASGQVMAATWFDNPPPIGARVDSAVVLTALQGDPTWDVSFNAGLGDQVLDVAVPVTGPGRIVGVVRLGHSLEEIQRRVAPLRRLVWVTLGAGAALSMLLGWVLAQSLAAPLQRLAAAVASFTPTAPAKPVPETGPDEVRTLASAFNRLSARLVELERSRTLLLTGIVHELGRPLGAIKAAAQTIYNSPDHDLAIELAGGIDHQVNQLRLQVEDLALLSEMELQEPVFVFEPVDIATLLEAQCAQFASTAADKQIALICKPDPTLPLIQADPKRIIQIMDNLLHNALKYTPAGGATTVNARLAPATNGAGPQILIEVSDTGPGIAPGEQARIFEFFYRSPAQRRIHQGMGIGLALARQLAQRHGGDLTVTSVEDRGATFTLRLPVQPAAVLGGQLMQP